MDEYVKVNKDQMLNNFKEHFGPPEVYLINEFRTSILCNGYHEKMHYFHERVSPQTKHHKGKKMPYHELLRCQSVKHSCEVSQGVRKTAEIIHYRNKNAAAICFSLVNDQKNLRAIQE